MTTELVPGVRIEISDIKTASLTTATKVLVFGIKTTGSLAVNTPTRVFSPDQGIEFAGRGSQAAQMLQSVFAEYRDADVTVVLMAAPAGVVATGTLTYSGTATTATPILLQIEDQIVIVPISLGDVAATIAASANTALAAARYADLHVTSGAAGALQTLTARSIGAHGNQIKFRVLQNTPGVTVTPVAMAGGTLDPDLSSAIAVIGGERYKYWVLPDTASANLTAAITELDDRWTKERQVDGHAIAAKRDTVGNLATLGLGLDSKHVTIFGDPSVPANPWTWAARVAGLRASVANPKFTLYNIDIRTLLAPDETLYLASADQQTLLAAGIATFRYVNGRARVQRFATVYKNNELGQPSNVFYDAETKLTASEIRQLQILVLQPQIGKTLVNDVGATQYDISTAANIIDVEGIRQILIAQNTETFQPQAWTDNAAYFEEQLQVVRSGQNEVTIVCSPPITGTNYVNNGTIEVVFSFNAG